MHIVEYFQQDALPSNWFWHNEPPYYGIGNGLEITTGENTDLWQNTYYGFKKDNGHCLLTRLPEEFSISTHVSYQPCNQYDQCGLIVRIDSENWIKMCTEYEDAEASRLGSVVTNFGFSDWATQDVASSHTEMWYRIQRRGKDFLLEHSQDGQAWRQMRIAHLHKETPHYAVGVYACSPTGNDFQCNFKKIEICESLWKTKTP